MVNGLSQANEDLEGHGEQEGVGENPAVNNTAASIFTFYVCVGGGGGGRGDVIESRFSRCHVLCQWVKYVGSYKKKKRFWGGWWLVGGWYCASGFSRKVNDRAHSTSTAAMCRRLHISR